MNFLQKYPILQKLLSPFRRSQQKTCAAVVSAVCAAGAANSFAIAAEIAAQNKIGLASALNRLYRFLRNKRFDDWLLSEQLFAVFADRKHIVLSLDWTTWHSRFALLVASVAIDKRAVPVAVTAVKKRLLARSQNLWEETFLRLCVDRLRAADVKAIWLCDRGFRRCSWLAALLALKQDFVVRLQSDVLFASGDEPQRALRDVCLQKGEFADLGVVNLRVDKAVRVRVVGVWAENSKEVWWLATNLTLPVADLAALYDRRMSCEEQFRDAKGARFGARLRWTQFERGEYLERMYLLVGVAMLLWTAVGRSVEKKNKRVRLRCRKKGARVSLVRVGIFYWRTITRTVRIGIRFIKEHLPPPRFRLFPWLVAAAPQQK